MTEDDRRDRGRPRPLEATMHRGWHHRGYLPHCDQAGQHQVITYHLADSLPQRALERMAQAVEDPQRERHLQELMDAGHGSCLLREHQIAAVVEDAWYHGDGKHYDLCAWVVMPNHVHVLIRTWQDHPLERIVAGWKSFTAHAINRLAGRRGQLWHPDYFDRFIRDQGHYHQAVSYIEDNPVTSRLCPIPAAWPWSSAAVAGLPIVQAAWHAAGRLHDASIHAAGTAAIPAVVLPHDDAPATKIRRERGRPRPHAGTS